MKRQLDLRSGRVLVALGTLGLGGAYATTAAVSAHAEAGATGGQAAKASDGPPDPRGAVVFTDSVGEAANALQPGRPVEVRPVVSATQIRRTSSSDRTSPSAGPFRR